MRALRAESHRLLFAAALVLGAGEAGALPGWNSPFLPGEHRAASLDSCDASSSIQRESPPKGTVEYRRGNMHLVLNLLEYGYEATVLDGSTEIGSTVFVVQDVVGSSDVQESDAVCADLNGDGKLDFAVLISEHGNASGSSDATRLIALSSPDSYRYWRAPASFPSPDDFVTYGKTAPVVLVTTRIVRTMDPEHTYFLYDLWRFNGSEIESANALDPRFPAFVLYSNGENHKLSKLLSSDVKKRLRGAESRTEPAPVEPRSLR
jgi:hypothetical protein